MRLFTIVTLLCVLPDLVSVETRLNPQPQPARTTPFVSFLEKTLLSVPATREIEVGDLNGDEALDIIYITNDPAVLWVSTGDGKGNFALPTRHGFPTGFSNTAGRTTVVVGDYDGNGRDEFLHFQTQHIQSESGEATLFLSTSDLGDDSLIHERLSISLSGTGIAPESHVFLYAGDVDGDRRSDFIFGDNASDELFVVRNVPGLWGSPAINHNHKHIKKIRCGRISSSSQTSNQVIMLDANNDGLTDIVKMQGQEVFVMRGSREAIFVRSEKDSRGTTFVNHLPGLTLGPNPRVMYGRLNRDDYLDLFIFNDLGPSGILLNNEGGGFEIYIPFESFQDSFIEMGDFNGDGIDDLVSYGGGHAGIRILLNGGQGYFTRTIEKQFGEKAVGSLTVFDFNRDGLSDIVLTLRSSIGGMEGRVLQNITQVMRN